MDFKIVMDGTMWIVADAPEPRLDFETKQPRMTEDGQPMWQVRLLGMDGAGSVPLRVGMVGDPGVIQGQFVTPQNLTLHVIDRKGDSVLWWTADRLETTGSPPAPDNRARGEASGGTRRPKDGDQ